jgi:hypothetical protein
MCTAATRAHGSQLVVYASSQAGNHSTIVRYVVNVFVCCLYPVIGLYASVVSTCDCTGFPVQGFLYRVPTCAQCTALHLNALDKQPTR